MHWEVKIKMCWSCRKITQMVSGGVLILQLHEYRIRMYNFCESHRERINFEHFLNIDTSSLL